MNRPRFITGIDWKALSLQKLHLLYVIASEEDENKKESLTGILHLLDAMQDYAVDSMGIDENIVFHHTMDSRFVQVNK